MNVNDFEKQVQGQFAEIGLETVKGLGEGAAQVNKETNEDSIERSKAKDPLDFVPPSEQPVLQRPKISQAGHNDKGASSGAIQGSSGAVSLELEIDKPYTKVAYASILVMQQILSDIAKQWNESVGEVADRKRAELNSTLHRSTEQYLHEIRMGEHDGTFSHANTVQAAFVVGAPFAAFIAGSNQWSDASKVTFDTLRESMATTTQFMTDSNMAMTAGYIGALFAQAAFLQAAWLTVGNTEKAQNGGSNLAQAQNYANRVVALCGDTAFTNYLSAIVAHHLEGGPQGADPQLVAKWVNYTKLGMMFHALAVLYKAQMGAWTPEEVAGQLQEVMDPNGKPLKDNDPRRPLLTAIANALMALPEGERAQVIMALMNLLGNAKNLKDLENPTAVLEGLLADKDIKPQLKV